MKKRINWKAYIWPKFFCITPKKKQDKRKIVSAGRRCGKTGLVHHTIIESLPVSNEKKKELHELYEKALRGEE